MHAIPNVARLTRTQKRTVIVDAFSFVMTFVHSLCTLVNIWNDTHKTFLSTYLESVFSFHKRLTRKPRGKQRYDHSLFMQVGSKIVRQDCASVSSLQHSSQNIPLFLWYLASKSLKIMKIQWLCAWESVSALWAQSLYLVYLCDYRYIIIRVDAYSS
jgi:hypothetical protein